MTLENYLRHRRRWEALIGISLIGIGVVANAVIELIDAERTGATLRAGEPWILELTSNGVILLLIPLLLWFDHRNPLTLRKWRIALAAHALFSVAFSLAHVTLMYWLRVVCFRIAYDTRYRWDHWLGEFGYEYLKDFRTYIFVLSTVYLYRFVLRRLQGEAGYINETPEPADTGSSERFIVKKLGREFLINVRDIEWIESAGNYANLHVSGKIYPLRDTMKNVSEKLAAKGFIRVHRQAIVNAKRVAEFEVFDSGDGQLQLDTGATVPLSRRYRKALRDDLQTV